MAVMIQRSRFGWWLNLVGVALVAVFLVQEILTRSVPAVAATLMGVSLAAWLCLLLLPERHRVAGYVAVAIMVCTAALAAASTDGLATVTVIVGIMAAVSDLRTPLWFGFAAAAAGMGLIAAGSLGTGITIWGILSIEAGALIGVLVGYSRRQLRESERKNAQLREQEAAQREDRERARLLASRQGLARDIHDVLAHSLGGLVIQLDAVDALLEAGRVEEAAARVTTARQLARSGLVEARRAVDALRDPGGDSADMDLRAQLGELAAAHRSILGEQDALWVVENGTARAVPAPVGAAFRQLAQEALSNARKHAPGQPVEMVLDWPDASSEAANANAGSRAAETGREGSVLALTITNRMRTRTGAADAGAALAGSGGGHGLAGSGGGHGIAGMIERFHELGGSVEAGERDRDGQRAFTVSARADLAQQPPRTPLRLETPGSPALGDTVPGGPAPGGPVPVDTVPVGTAPVGTALDDRPGDVPGADGPARPTAARA